MSRKFIIIFHITLYCYLHAANNLLRLSAVLAAVQGLVTTLPAVPLSTTIIHTDGSLRHMQCGDIGLMPYLDVR